MNITDTVFSMVIMSFLIVIGYLIFSDHTVNRYYLGELYRSDRVYRVRAEKNWYPDPTVAVFTDFTKAISGIGQLNKTLEKRKK